MIKIIEYICKIASLNEMERKWDSEIKKHKNSNWSVWKNEAIARMLNGQSIVYFGLLNGKIISEATAMLDGQFVQNRDGLVNEDTAYLCAFRTVDKFQGRGYFSELFDFMIEDLRKKGYKKVTLGVEPCETENLKIYQHFGFNEFIKAGTECYPDGTVINVNYYGMELC